MHMEFFDNSRGPIVNQGVGMNLGQGAGMNMGMGSNSLGNAIIPMASSINVNRIISLMNDQSPSINKFEVRVDRNTTPAFLEKLYDLLCEESGHTDIVSWMPCGTSFIIKKPTEMSEQVLPRYFKHNNLQSFIRQLNMYCFVKTRHDSNHREFRHDSFLKGRADLLKYIKRKPQRIQSKSGHDSDGEANGEGHEGADGSGLKAQVTELEAELCHIHDKLSALEAQHTRLLNFIKETNGAAFSTFIEKYDAKMRAEKDSINRARQQIGDRGINSEIDFTATGRTSSSPSSPDIHNNVHMGAYTSSSSSAYLNMADSQGMNVSALLPLNQFGSLNKEGTNDSNDTSKDCDNDITSVYSDYSAENGGKLGKRDDDADNGKGAPSSRARDEGRVLGTIIEDDKEGDHATSKDDPNSDSGQVESSKSASKGASSHPDSTFQSTTAVSNSSTAITASAGGDEVSKAIVSNEAIEETPEVRHHPRSLERGGMTQSALDSYRINLINRENKANIQNSQNSQNAQSAQSAQNHSEYDHDRNAASAINRPNFRRPDGYDKGAGEEDWAWQEGSGFGRHSYSPREVASRDRDSSAQSLSVGGRGNLAAAQGIPDPMMMHSNLASMYPNSNYSAKSFNNNNYHPSQLYGFGGLGNLGGINGLTGMNGINNGMNGLGNLGMNSLNSMHGMNGLGNIGINGINSINGINGMNGYGGLSGLGGMNGYGALNGLGGMNGINRLGSGGLGNQSLINNLMANGNIGFNGLSDGLGGLSSMMGRNPSAIDGPDNMNNVNNMMPSMPQTSRIGFTQINGVSDSLAAIQSGVAAARRASNDDLALKRRKTGDL